MRPAVMILLLAVIPATVAHSQETTGNLTGRVLDPDGAPADSVTITVSGPNLPGTREARTAADGRFRVLALPVGSYTVRVAHAEFQPVDLEQVVVRLGGTTDLGDLRLAVETYELEEMVVVGRTPLIDPTSTVMGFNLDSEEFADLPLDRNYRNMVTLLPHVNTSYLGDGVGFGGGTGMENNYYIDGVDNSDAVLGMASTALPYNFVREVHVRTGGYQAEYRGALGGSVEVVTHSGGDTHEGQVFGFYVNDRLTGPARSTYGDPDTGSYALYDVGFLFSGPIIKDRLRYAVAYNPAFSQEEVALPSLGFYDYDGVSHRFATKLTWRAATNHDLELSVYGDPTTFEGVAPPRYGGIPAAMENPDPLLRSVESGGLTAVLNGHSRLSDSFSLEPTISYVTQSGSFLPLTERGNEPHFYDANTFTSSGGTLYDQKTDSRITTVGLRGTLFTGDHVLKGGLEYRNISTDYQDEYSYIDLWPDGHYRSLESAHDGNVRNRIASAFLQDSWRIGGRLNLNLGVRWEGQYLYGSDGEIAVRFTDQWQPRAGFTYQLGESGSQQLFGSYGRFYQELSMEGPAFFFTYGATYQEITWDHDPRFDPVVGPGDTIRINAVSEPQGEIEGIEGQHFDEFTLGYERRLSQHSKLTLRGVYRELGNGIEDVWSPTAGEWLWGNPGYGELNEFPPMTRDYSALELTYQLSGADRGHVLASYTLSRSRGNYSGIFDLTSHGGGYTNAQPAFDFLQSLENGDGLLPNDRTHSFKLSGSYRLGAGLTVGATALWQSGTPLNELGIDGWGAGIFIIPRGEAGRTSSIWDLSMRLTYDFSVWWDSQIRPRILVDLLHIGSPREAADYEQVRYLEQDEDGDWITEYPLYGEPVAYQPPFGVRLGVTVDF